MCRFKKQKQKKRTNNNNKSLSILQVPITRVPLLKIFSDSSNSYRHQVMAFRVYSITFTHQDIPPPPWTFQRAEPTGLTGLFPSCCCTLLTPGFISHLMISAPASHFAVCLHSFWHLPCAPPGSLGLDILHLPCSGDTLWVLLEASSQPCPNNQHLSVEEVHQE